LPALRFACLIGTKCRGGTGNGDHAEKAHLGLDVL
jgi:hypothetical protein